MRGVYSKKRTFLLEDVLNEVGITRLEFTKHTKDIH